MSTSIFHHVRLGFEKFHWFWRCGFWR